MKDDAAEVEAVITASNVQVLKYTYISREKIILNSPISPAQTHPNSSKPVSPSILKLKDEDKAEEEAFINASKVQRQKLICIIVQVYTNCF